MLLRAGRDDDELEELNDALHPPLSWRDPLTSRPAGWEDDDADVRAFMVALHS